MEFQAVNDDYYYFFFKEFAPISPSFKSVFQNPSPLP